MAKDNTRRRIEKRNVWGIFQAQFDGQAFVAEMMNSVNIGREELTMPDDKSFDQVFARLKAIFQPYAKKMDVAQDNQTYYLLNTRHIMKNKQPLCFGGVRLGKAYV